MSQMGQTEKNSVRAYVFRFAPQTRTLLDAVGMSQTCHLQTIGVSEKPPSRKPQRYAAQLPDESD